MEIIQQPDKITFVYSGNMDVRHVRLNQRHQEPLTPSLYGDSVGHYEGDTLVIDTVGQRTNRPYAMIDLFGTLLQERGRRSARAKAGLLRVTTG